MLSLIRALGLVCSVVALVALIRGGRMCGGSNRSVARGETAALAVGVEMFALVHKRCPDSLTALAHAGITRRARPDPWGRPYALTCVPTLRLGRVCSAGFDGAFGTEDDVCAEARVSPGP